MFTICLRLEQIGGDSDAIQLNRKSIATFFLWVAGAHVLNGPPWLFWQSDTTQHAFFQLWDRIHLVNLAPTTIYLDTLLSYVNVNHGRVTERLGSEQGARAASLCLLRVLSGVDPTSATLEDMRKRYLTVFPPKANFEGLLCYHTINAIHAVLVRSKIRGFFRLTNYMPCAQEHIFFANTLVRIAHNGKLHGKVPRWVLRFVIHSLDRCPQPQMSVVADCLTTIAIDLGCDIPEDDIRNPDKRYERLAQLHSLLY